MICIYLYSGDGRLCRVRAPDGGERGLVGEPGAGVAGSAPHPHPTPVQRFLGHPESPGDPTVDEWLADFDVFVRQCGVPEGERAVVLVD